MTTMQGVAAQIAPGSFWVNNQDGNEYVRVTELVTWKTCPDSVGFIVLGETSDRELLVGDFRARFERVSEDDAGLGLAQLRELDVRRT